MDWAGVGAGIAAFLIAMQGIADRRHRAKPEHHCPITREEMLSLMNRLERIWEVVGQKEGEFYLSHFPRQFITSQHAGQDGKLNSIDGKCNNILNEVKR